MGVFPFFIPEGREREASGPITKFPIRWIPWTQIHCGESAGEDGLASRGQVVFAGWTVASIRCA